MASASLPRRLTLANAPVQSVIYELAELKGLIVLLSGLNNKHGKFIEGYSSAAISYVRSRATKFGIKPTLF